MVRSGWPVSARSSAGKSLSWSTGVAGSNKFLYTRIRRCSDQGLTDFGTAPDAVKARIWMATCVYDLFAVAKSMLRAGERIRCNCAISRSRCHRKPGAAIRIVTKDIKRFQHFSSLGETRG